MDEITIHVTEEDIANSVRADTHQCAIAVAAKREHLDYIGAAVTYTWIALTEEDNCCTVWSLPEKAREFISDFDGGFPVEPFKFTVTDKISEYT